MYLIIFNLIMDYREKFNQSKNRLKITEDLIEEYNKINSKKKD